eukprot:2898768-Rhodomonas_salina.2
MASALSVTWPRPAPLVTLHAPHTHANATPTRQVRVTAAPPPLRPHKDSTRRTPHIMMARVAQDRPVSSVAKTATDAQSPQAP